MNILECQVSLIKWLANTVRWLIDHITKKTVAKTNNDVFIIFPF